MKGNRLKFVTIVGVFTLFFSCNKGKFLEEKPDQGLVVPNKLEDFQAILDNDRIMNGTVATGVLPTFGEISSDDYYFPANILGSEEQIFTDLYTWNLDAGWGTRFLEWRSPYQTVFYANLVLDGLKKLQVSPFQQAAFDNAMGSALFFRSFMFYHIAQIFCKHYDKNTAYTDLGIPLRMTSDVNEVIFRSTVQDTYDQIIADLKNASLIMPDFPVYKTRPSKWAAYAMLARVYLTMGEYDSAYAYSDKCLQLGNTLIDFNTLTITASNYPIQRFNPEVIFHCVLLRSNLFLLDNSLARIDSILYSLYTPSDIRRQAYFRNRSDGVSFRGSYDQGNSNFGGLAVDEMYLVRAECLARKGFVDQAINDLNTLLVKRSDGSFTPLTAATKEEALDIILLERRKELLMRGLRWSDLRRLNSEGKNIVLKRNLDGNLHTLNPSELRYTFLIPSNVLGFNPEMSQNPR